MPRPRKKKATVSVPPPKQTDVAGRVEDWLSQVDWNRVGRITWKTVKIVFKIWLACVIVYFFICALPFLVLHAFNTVMEYFDTDKGSR